MSADEGVIRLLCAPDQVARRKTVRLCAALLAGEAISVFVNRDDDNVMRVDASRMHKMRWQIASEPRNLRVIKEVGFERQAGQQLSMMKADVSTLDMAHAACVVSVAQELYSLSSQELAATAPAAIGQACEIPQSTDSQALHGICPWIGCKLRDHSHQSHVS